MNKISIGFKTSSWDNHPPVFKEGCFCALYLLITFFFFFLMEVNGWMPLQPTGLSWGCAHTPWVSNLCVLCGGEVGAGARGGKRNRGLPLLEPRGPGFDPHPAAEMDLVGEGLSGKEAPPGSVTRTLYLGLIPCWTSC